MIEDQNLWTHDKLQAMCWQWHYNSYPEDRGYIRLIYSNPRNKIQGAKLKAAGLTAGTPDMVWWRKKQDIFFEFKVGKDKLSDDQISTHEILKSVDKMVYVIKTIDQYIDYVRRIKIFK
jgi:hypothetical protein